MRSAPPGEPADVTVVATTATWLRWLYDPTLERAGELDLEITGRAPALRRFERLLRKFPAAAAAPH